MFKRKSLACSFCGRSAAEVAKLVAGPGVHICDACVTEAARIMSTPGGDAASRPASPSAWMRLADRIVRLFDRLHLRAV